MMCCRSPISRPIQRPRIKCKPPGDGVDVKSDSKTNIGKFCCVAKQSLSHTNALVDTLAITPRVVICKKPMIKGHRYEQLINIKNTGLYPRKLRYFSDCPEEMIISIPVRLRDKYLDPDTNIKLSVIVRPIKKEKINRTRRVYIQCDHPNIIIEILFVVILKGSLPTIPEKITFPSSIPKTKSFYDIVLYNPTSNPISFVVRCLNPRISFLFESNKIHKKDYSQVLIQLDVLNMAELSETIKLKYSNGSYQPIIAEHVPIQYSIHLNNSHIIFEELKYERELTREFTICNESDLKLSFAVNFFTEQLESEECSEECEEREFACGNETSEFDGSVIDKKSTIEEKPEPFGKWDYKHFTIDPKSGTFNPNSATTFTLTFHPVMAPECDFDISKDSPFFVKTRICFTAFFETNYQHRSLVVMGHIKGPEVEFTPTTVDLRKVYMGEEQCERIKALNVDGLIDSQVDYLGADSNGMAEVHITPTEYNLKPCVAGVFQISLYSIDIGRFIIKLMFKVRNGKHYTIVYKGHSERVRVRILPEIIELGAVPVAVPQKRSILILNPLASVMSIQCTVSDDGSETPLVLNIRDVEDMLPVTVKNPYHKLNEQIDDYVEEEEEEDEGEEEGSMSSNECASVSFKSISTDVSSYSAAFEDEIIEQVDAFAAKVVRNIKQSRLADKSEPVTRCLREALCCLIDTRYFRELDEYKNYAYMDWNAVPSSPRELYVETDIFQLLPNASKHITLMLIPNTVGYFNRSLDIRICPVDDYKKTDYTSLVDSSFMTTKLWIEYNCQIPDVQWDDIITFYDYLVFAGQDYNFSMIFRSLSNVLGFIYYDTVPDCEDGVMTFVDNVWKFCIEANREVEANCSVTFHRFGRKKLSGLVKFVGNTMGYPFHLQASVLPVKVRYHPKQIAHRQKVLERTRTYVYIENHTPTITWLRIYLKREGGQYVEPMGMILGPKKQGMYVVIHTMFRDPEVHKNILYLDLVHGRRVEIPLEFTIDEMPIFFSPNLRDGGVDTGYILTNSEDDFYGNRPIFSSDIKLSNAGKRSYRISITKQRGSLTYCSVTTVRARITVTPKSTTVQPGTDNYIHITADSLDELELVNEFRIRIVDQANKTRVLNILFTVTARFVDPQIRWHPKTVIMNYYRTHKFKEHPKQESVNLNNSVEVAITSVKLQVLGPFKIKHLFEEPFVKELEFPMDSAESRELVIILKKSAVKPLFCTHLDGRVLCWANGRPQKTLHVRVNVFDPEVVISQSEMVVFAENVQHDVTLEIGNVGCMDAEFKWKKLEDGSKFIGDFDDAVQFSHQILDDLLCMLELSESEPRIEIRDKFCKLNMTETYQRYLCELRKLEDNVGISLIVDEIIDNLDLEHKRYNIKLDENIGTEDSMDDVTKYSSQRYVKKTIERVLDLLKLEDSYDISEPSGDDCVLERAIYFYEKGGVLLECEKRKCLIHLPPIRKGYVQKAVFQLDVVGGKSHSFEIIAVNLDKTIELSKHSVYVGMRPWYENFKVCVRGRNVTEYTIKLQMAEMDNSRHCHNISYGNLELTSERLKEIPMFETTLIKAQGILGFCQEYNRRIKVTINEGEERMVNVRGQGIMPILSVTTKMERVDQLYEHIVDEYSVLQRIYFFDVFKSITEEDIVEAVVQEEENVAEDVPDSEYSLMSSIGSEASDNTTRTYERRFFKVMQSYVMVNNNEELPNATVLEQMIETEKFLERLKVNRDTCHLLYLVYQDYVKMRALHDERMPINLKHFTVQPLPFELHGHILNMNQLQTNQFRRFEINLHFFGPGKLIAAARTVIKIPGLVVDFKIEESFGKEFIYYTAEGKSPDFYDKPYRNMYEREIDLDTDPKLKHAHSFDFDAHTKHLRQCSAKERKQIENYYNSLNKSVYMEHKHHYVLCKIFTNSKQNFSGTEMRVIVLIKPEAKFYENGQMLEDYLFIDLHMGPTLPILLRGLITKS